MTNSKNHAFLMCPTSRTTHLGGTPLESGEAGGHIRKTWISAFEAALAGLPARVRNDQAMHLGARWAENAVKCSAALLVAGTANRLNLERLGVVPMVVLAGATTAVSAKVFARWVDAAVANCGANCADRRAPLLPMLLGASETESGKRVRRPENTLPTTPASYANLRHGLGLHWLNSLSGGMIHQRATATVGPVFVLYTVPKSFFGEQHLTGQHGVAFALKGDSKLFRARAGAVGHVLQVATGRINLQGKSLALFNAQALPISFKVHG